MGFQADHDRRGIFHAPADIPVQQMDAVIPLAIHPVRISRPWIQAQDLHQQAGQLAAARISHPPQGGQRPGAKPDP